MSTSPIFNSPTRSIDALAPSPHMKSPAKHAESKCGAYPAHKDHKAYDQHHGAQTSTGKKFLIAAIVFIVTMLLAALILYVTRPPLILVDLDHFVLPNEWPISPTKLWGWSALFALVIAIIALILA